MNYILAGIEPMPTAKQLKETILRYLLDARLSFHSDPLAMAFHKMSQAFDGMKRPQQKNGIGR